MTKSSVVSCKRAYDAPDEHDGFRILVDRVWPRGVTKADAKLDLWCREIAPTAALRKWFGHDPARFAEFRRRYRAELASNPAAVSTIRQQLRRGPVTLVYGARDTEHNQAVVLAEFLAHPRRV